METEREGEFGAGLGCAISVVHFELGTLWKRVVVLHLYVRSGMLHVLRVGPCLLSETAYFVHRTKEWVTMMHDDALVYLAAYGGQNADLVVVLGLRFNGCATPWVWTSDFLGSDMESGVDH